MGKTESSNCGSFLRHAVLSWGIFCLLLCAQISPAQTTTNAMLVYGQLNNYYPQFRIWTGSAWSAPSNALSAGNANINYVIVKACPIRDEYAAVTLNANREVRAQIWRDGEWGNPQTIASVPNAANRGVDIAYESLSGEAVVVCADGDDDPTYYVWTGDGWTGPGAINVSRTSAARWIKLAADPGSDELIMMSMNQNRYYTAQVWNGSNAWGNELLCSGQAVNVAYEAMDVRYETSGNQAIIVNNSGTANNGRFNWCAWSGSAWGVQNPNTSLGDYMRFGRLENDPNSDGILLAYVDNDSDIGKVYWNGASFGNRAELETSGRSVVERCVYGIFENISGHTGHALVCYGDNSRGRSRHSSNPSSATWQAEVSAATGNYVVQAARTGDGKILALWFARGVYYFSLYNGTAWSSEEVIENNASVRSSPLKEPFMIAPQLSRRPLNLYYVGRKGIWNSVVPWAAVSGGPGGRGAPKADVRVFFDANSPSNCMLTGSAAARSLNTTGYTNAIFLGTNPLVIAENLVHGGGLISVGNAASGTNLDVNGSITNASVITCSGASKIYCAGDWNGSAGVFNASSSTVMLDGSTMFDTTDDGLGTVSAQVMGATPPGEDMLKAFDNTLTTKWLDFATNNPITRASWIQYQYPDGEAHVVANYTISSANDYPVRDPRDWKLLGSNDGGNNWVVVDVRTGQLFTARFQTKSFSVSNSTAFNIYRLQIDTVVGPGLANSVQLSEIELNEISGLRQRVITGGAWSDAASSNNWKNNWSTLEVKNVTTGGVVFLDGFRAEQLIATQQVGSCLSFAPQQGCTNVYEVTASNGLKLSGGASIGSYIKLRRSGGAIGERWEIYPSAASGAWSVNYVDVSDSVNTASNAIMPVVYADGGNTVNWFAPTFVAMGWFKAVGRNNSVSLRWKTEAEINTAGFNVYRSLSPEGGFVRINGNFIWGLGTSSRGREYKFSDDDVQNGITYYYRLEEVEFSGRSSWHGPEAAHPGIDGDRDGMSDDWEVFYGLDPAADDANGDPDGDGLSSLQEFAADCNPMVDEGGAPSGWRNPHEDSLAGNAGIYKMIVRTNGIYRVTAGYLQGAAGVSNLAAWSMASIRVYNRGAEIPLRVHDDGDAGFGENDYFEFYGSRLDTRFSDANVYWLYHSTNGAGGGLRMPEVDGKGANPMSSARHLEHFELNETYQDALPDEAPDDDHWFFNDWLVATNSHSNAIELQPVLGAISDEDDSALVRVALRSIGSLAAHRLKVALNGVDLEDGYWEGNGQYVYSSEISRTNLRDGANSIRLALAGDTGAAFEQVLVNWVEIEYPRALLSDGSSLQFSSCESEAFYTCNNFSSGDLRVYRVASETNVAIITNAVVFGTGPYALSFGDSLGVGETGVAYAVLGPQGAMPPAAIAEDSPSDLRSTLNGADYIIVACEAFTNALRPLAEFRAARGLRVRTVALQDVYDDFNFGIASPYAIRDFMAYARANWQRPAPSFLLLVGDATYDYRDYEGMGAANMVPSKLVHDSDSVEAPSDNWFVALDSADDYLPDMHVGRLPARTAAEVADMASKIIAYEQSVGTGWDGRILLAADNEAQFEDISETVYGRLPDDYKAAAQKIYLSARPIAECRELVTNGVNAGALIAHYAGHGSIRFWADEYLFQVEDLVGLTNSPALPFFVTPTCWNGYFIVPPGYDFEGLAEELVRKTGGGACACFSPSGLSVPPHHKILVDNLFRSIFQEGAFTIGPAVTRAKSRMHEQIFDSSRNAVQIFMLFGDPAMRLKQRAGATNDVLAPVVLNVSPVDGQENVGLMEEIRIAFSEPMDDVSARAAFSISPTVDGSVVWEDETLVFQPEDCYTPGTVYTISVKSNACDLAGNRLDRDYTSVFARTYPSGALAIDVAPDRGSWRMSARPVAYHGVTSATGDLTAAIAPEGVYEIAFDSMPGYTAPGVQTQAVHRGVLARVSGIYNRCPVIAEGSAITRYYGEADLLGGIEFELHAEDEEDDSIAWSIASQAAHGSVRLDGDGAVRTVFYQPASGYRGDDNFTLQVADAAGGKSETAVAIVFNRPPQLSPVSGQTVEIGEELAFTVRASDPDGETPVLTMLRGPANALFVDNGDGTGSFTWTPSGVRDLGEHYARFSASDGHVASSIDVVIHVATFAVASPEDGGIARRGGPLRVAWSGARVLGAVTVDLWRGTNFIMVLTNNLASPSDRMSWQSSVPFDARPGRDYRIGVREAANAGNMSYSGSFTILAQCPNDFDGDGLSDMSLFNRATGHWIVYGSTSGIIRMAFDGAGLSSAPWDYDGDSRVDFVVYQESAGKWTARVRLSASKYLSDEMALGGRGFGAAPGDYDGDGRLDLAVYQEETGRWMMLLSSSGYRPDLVLGGNFGGAGYRFVTGDFDGDAKSDPALYRADSGEWIGLLSSAGYASRSADFGGPAFSPVPGDYDGDGTSDIAVYGDQTGEWFVSLSGAAGSVYVLVLGGPGHRPVPGDYDGDGLTDFVVYDESAGEWSGRLSASGYAPVAAAFGGSGFSAAVFEP